MAGNKAGAAKARETNKRKYGENFYQVIGALGGVKGAKDGTIKGFAKNPELASEAGRKGGLVTGDRYKTRTRK